MTLLPFLGHNDVRLQFPTLLVFKTFLTSHFVASTSSKNQDLETNPPIGAFQMGDTFILGPNDVTPFFRPQ